MFIKITKNQRGEGYYHLVESYREEGKVKQRTLLSLGKVEEGKLEQLSVALSKFTKTKQIIELSKSVDVKDTYILGPVLLLDRIYENLGIRTVLEQIQKQHEKLQFDLEKIIFTQLCSRFIKPVSKLCLYDKWLERLYPQMIDHDISLQHIYRSLDLLAMHKENIEQHLYGYQRDLFSMQVDVVLYDLTTLRFESIREDLDQYRRFGYSKEKRSDCTQVVLGLLTDTNGIPLCFEVHPGNTFEGKTLDGIVDKMKKKFSIRRFIFVADRGLFSWDNLEHIRKAEGEFIVGMKIGSMTKQIKEDFYNINNFRWINEELAVYETKIDEDRCIITWSKSRAERDRKAREDILEKIKKKLCSKTPITKKFITNRNYQKYVIIEDKSKCSLNQKAIDQEAKKDGFFGVISNVEKEKMNASEIVTNYKQLWKIEDAFGEIKGNLKTRPVFHWTDNRIIGHLTLCFLAYLCESYLTKSLRENFDKLQSKAIENKIIKQRPLTVVQAMDELSRVQAIPISIADQTLWVRTDIPPNAQAIIKAIGMKIPPKILTPLAKV
jgi:transposase